MVSKDMLIWVGERLGLTLGFTILIFFERIKLGLPGFDVLIFLVSLVDLVVLLFIRSNLLRTLSNFIYKIKLLKM